MEIIPPQTILLLSSCCQAPHLHVAFIFAGPSSWACAVTSAGKTLRVCGESAQSPGADLNPNQRRGVGVSCTHPMITHSHTYTRAHTHCTFDLKKQNFSLFLLCIYVLSSLRCTRRRRGGRCRRRRRRRNAHQQKRR